MALTKTKKKKRRPDHFQSKAKSTKKINPEDFSLEQVKAFENLLYFDTDIYNQHANTQATLLIGFDEVGRGSIAGPVCTGAFCCSALYKESDELLNEIKLARQVISDQLLNTNSRDSYYAETLCNDLEVAEDLDQLNSLSALLNLEDSKKVSKAKREFLTQSLSQIPCLDSDGYLFYSTSFESAKKIDKIGIVECIWYSMVKNLINIIEQYQDIEAKLPKEIILLVDGPKEIAKLYEKIKKLKPEFKNINFIQIAIKKGDSKSSLIAAASNIAKLKRDKHMKKLSHKFKGFYWENNAGYGTRRHYEAIHKFGLTPEHRKSYLSSL